MQVKQRPLESLIHYSRNNRKHSELQVDRIANSIRDFGFNQPIVVDEDSVILVGHGRALAAKKLGIKDVPVLQVPGLTSAQKRAYRILDNKLQNDSEWDFESLGIELEQLTAEGFDTEAWGLDQLKDLFPVNEPEVTEDDFTAPEIEEPFIKRGDLIELGPHRLLCGDSTSAEDVESLLVGAKPHLMVTDPPYGVEYDADWRNHAFRADGSTIGGRAIGAVQNDHECDWAAAYKLFPVTTAYVWHAGRYAKEVQESLEKSGFEIRCQIIWAKSNFVIGRGDYHWKHEPCWYAVKEGQTSRYNGDRAQTTLWEIAKPHKSETGHSTQKPIECMARPIRNNSNSGNAVVDPFLGSGTTLIAADQLNRRCYGMEIEPRYCQIIIERYKHHCEQSGKPFVCKVNGEPLPEEYVKAEKEKDGAPAVPAKRRARKESKVDGGCGHDRAADC